MRAPMRAMTRAITMALASALLLTATVPAWASAKSDRLVALFRDRQLLAAHRADCERRAAAVSPAALLQDNPNTFYGFNPKSRQWPEVVAIYRRYRRAMCAYLSPQGFTHAMSEQYAHSLSVPDLDAAIRFFASPVGQRLVKAHLAVDTAFRHLEYARYHAAYRQAMLRLVKSRQHSH